jgi:predicted amidohydrolase YtcJ
VNTLAKFPAAICKYVRTIFRAAKRRLPTVLCVGVNALVLTTASAAEIADLVIINGSVYTVARPNRVVTAVAIRHGLVWKLGSDAEIVHWVGATTTTVDLHGATAFPGFKDSHAHLLDLGLARMQVDLEGAADFDEVVKRVQPAVAASRSGDWIVGNGWHEEKWTHPPPDAVHGFPVHQRLSTTTPNNPVVLNRADGHALLANARAMELMHITAETPSPPGGLIVHDEKGAPTGVFVDNAMDLVKVPAESPETKRKAWALAFSEALRSGLTAVDEPGLGVEDVRLLKELAAEDKIPLRLYVMLGGWDTLQHVDRPEIGLDHGMLTIRAVKLYADGALGSRGAALLAPYDDDPGNTGLIVTPVDELRKAMDYAFNHGFQVATHAIGDRGNRLILDLYQETQARDPSKTDLRWRIEHAQVLSAQDIPRFAKLGVIASMQTVHATSDRPWAPDRIGIERVKEGAYAWRKLLATGAHIANGTDAPVESIDPIRNFYAAVTREDEKGNPPGGFDPEEKMTPEEALRSYTIEGAYATFTEHEAGSIEIGKNADLVVLSKDIMKIPERDILKTKVVMTIVGGKVVYDASKAH